MDCRIDQLAKPHVCGGEVTPALPSQPGQNWHSRHPASIVSKGELIQLLFWVSRSYWAVMIQEWSLSLGCPYHDLMQWLYIVDLREPESKWNH